MAEVMLTKKVEFIGAWRAVTLTDYLQRTIVDQVSKKKGKGFPCKLNITSKGMELYMVNNKKEVIRTESMPLETIKDFTINKYQPRDQPMCVLVTVADSDRYVRIFVFLCEGNRDAAHLVQVYGQAKKSLSGEGYNFNLKTPHGQNWTLKQSPNMERKNETQFTFVKSYDERVRQNGNVKHLGDITDGKRRVYNIPQVVINGNKDDESFRILNEHKGGRMFYDVAVQTDFSRDNDIISTSTDMTSNEEIKDDLVHLSLEVKAIKLMLEEAREVSKTQYLRRSQIQETKRQDQSWEPVIITEVERSQPNETKQHGPGLGLSYVTVPSHDARSYGTQTIYKQNQRMTKNSWSRMPRRDQALHSQSSRSLGKEMSNSVRMGFSRRRYDSENPYASVENNPYAGMVVRKSRKRPAVRQMSGSSTIPGNVVVQTTRPRSVILSSTIPRNIEDVYKHQSIGRARPKSLVMSDFVQQEGSPPAILTTDTGDILRADEFEEVIIGGQSVVHTANQPKDVATVEFPPTSVVEVPQRDDAVVEFSSKADDAVVVFSSKEETVVKVGQEPMTNGDFSRHEEMVNDEGVLSTEIHVGNKEDDEIKQIGGDGIHNEIDVVLIENNNFQNGVGIMMNGDSKVDFEEEKRESGDGGSGDNSPKDDSDSIKKEITLIAQNYLTRVK